MKVLLLLMVTVFSFQAYAQDQYVCKKGHSERTVEVIYSQPNTKVPCEVKYTKPSGSQILWHAQHEIGYCEAQAQQFVTKLTGFGWSCQKVDTAAVTQPLT